MKELANQLEGYFPHLVYSFLLYNSIWCFCDSLYLKLFLNLPKRTKYLFVLSCSIFLIGQLAFEMLEGKHAEIYTRNNLTYAVYYTIEEFLEMMGLTIFIYALLDYIKNYFGNQINIELK